MLLGMRTTIRTSNVSDSEWDLRSLQTLRMKDSDSASIHKLGPAHMLLRTVETGLRTFPYDNLQIRCLGEGCNGLPGSCPCSMWIMPGCPCRQASTRREPIERYGKYAIVAVSLQVFVEDPRHSRQAVTSDRQPFHSRAPVSNTCSRDRASNTQTLYLRRKQKPPHPRRPVFLQYTKGS